MTAQILSGIAPSQAILASIQADVLQLDPKIVILQVGNDAASTSYIRQKIKHCKQVSMRYDHVKLPTSTSFEEMLTVIERLNTDTDITGFILQVPLPEALQAKLPQLIKAIDPKKDIDGFGAYNLGKMFLSTAFEHLPPATPAGVIALLEYYNITIQAKNVVVVGASNIVGKPLGIMLLNRGATVTFCHEFTSNVTQHTLSADIIVAAVGKQNLLTQDMVSDNAIVIDIGFNQTENGITGDVDFVNVAKTVQAITPVPGGIGPMTVACLLRNTITAKKRQLQLID